MNSKKMLSEIFKVSLSNISTLLSGIFVGFIIPKVLGSSEYGYYKMFTLYASYVGMFSFGIAEGMYLKYSGTGYNDLNKKRIRFFTNVYFKIQFVISLIILVSSIIFASGEYKYIFIALSIYLVELNITSYYQFVAQMTMRFSDYTIRNFVRTILTIIAVLLMVLFYFINGKSVLSYKYYVILTLIISTFLCIMYLRKFQDITFGDRDKYHEGSTELKELMRLGIPFLIASLCSTLILNIDKQFVSMLFDPAVYGTYAFAYSMLTLVTMCTSAISTVLYPSLKRSSRDNLAENLRSISSIVIVFVFFMMLSYFPLCIVVRWFLPKYIYSLEIFRIVFPGLAFTSLISVVFQNFYKLLEENARFLKQNVAILCLSVVANFIAYCLFKSPEAISWASIIVLVIYYHVSEYFFRKNYNLKWRRNFVYILTASIGFYSITCISNIYASMILYFIYFMIVTILLMPETIASLKNLIKNRRNDQ